MRVFLIRRDDASLRLSFFCSAPRRRCSPRRIAIPVCMFVQILLTIHFGDVSVMAQSAGIQSAKRPHARLSGRWPLHSTLGAYIWLEYLRRRRYARGCTGRVVVRAPELSIRCYGKRTPDNWAIGVRKITFGRNSVFKMTPPFPPSLCSSSSFPLLFSSSSLPVTEVCYYCRANIHTIYSPACIAVELRRAKHYARTRGKFNGSSDRSLEVGRNGERNGGAHGNSSLRQKDLKELDTLCSGSHSERQVLGTTWSGLRHLFFSLSLFSQLIPLFWRGSYHRRAFFPHPSKCTRASSP